MVACAPLPFEQFLLGSGERSGNSRLQSIRKLHQRLFRFGRCVPDHREVEPANWPGERVHVKISFEEARGVRDGEEAARSGVAAEAPNAVPGDPDRLHDFGQQFDCGDVAYTHAVRVEDVWKAIEETDSVGGFLCVRIEDTHAILRSHYSFEGVQIRSRSPHGPRRTQPVLGTARTHSLSNALRFRASGPVA